MFKKISGQKVIVIVGPTASGKSDLAIRLAQWLCSERIARQFSINGAEIISADSRQVYRGMDIGTGKVLKDKTFPVPNSKLKNQNAKFRNYFYSSGIRHHLIDVANPKKQFTADDFKKLGQKAIDDIVSRGKVPIVVGGAGFYIDILLGRMSVAEVPPNPALRKRFDKLTVEHLFKMLQKLDPKRAKKIEPKNKRRLVRALEIVLTSGKPVPNSKFKILNSKFDILWLGLKPRNIEKRIKLRLDERLNPASAKFDLATTGKERMIKEVVNLRKQGLSWKRLNNLGLEYRWVSRWLKKSKLQIPDSRFKDSGEYQNLLRDIVKYSKRQITWFKRNKEINWLTPSKTEEISNQKELTLLLKNLLSDK